MLKIYSIVAALALSALLAAPVGAQAQPSWTQAGMLRCVVNPSIGFIIAGHQTMECRFTPSAPNLPPQAYAGALNMIGLNIGISAGGVFGLGCACSHSWHSVRRARWRIRGRKRRHRCRPRRRCQRSGRGLWRTIALQPISLEGSVALDVSLGVSSLQLRPL